ncbi:S26 family signal peptidase [Planctomycetota bacterium]
MSNPSTKTWLSVSALALFLTVLSVVLVRQSDRGIAQPQIATVSGLSMSPSFRCAHFEMACVDCGHKFHLSAERPDGTPLDRPAANTRCPQCGELSVCVSSTPSQGDELQIEPAAGETNIDRFEVVAFGSDPLRIKRVLGLPGERIQIDGGDIIVDGSRLRKTFDQFMKTAVAVSDFRHNARGMPTARYLDQGTGWEFSKRVLDYNSFDQLTSRSLIDVGDIGVSLGMRFDSPVQFEIRLRDGWQEWRVQYDFIGKESVSVQLRNDDGLQSKAEFKPQASDLSTAIDVGCFDRQFVLNVMGGTVILKAFEKPTEERKAVPRPVSIHVGVGRAVIESIVVRRDVHYLPNAINEPFTTNAWHVRRNEYFLLGDYSPVSIDSRSPTIGLVGRSEIVGKVRPIETRGKAKR